MFNEEISLFEFKNENNYLDISVDNAKMEFVTIRGNYDPFTVELFEEVAIEINAISPDRVLIFTGKNNLGHRLASVLTGKIILLSHPTFISHRVANSNVIKVVESSNPEVDCLQYAYFESPVNIPRNDTQDPDERETEPPVIYKDESTYY
jgi:hypothetical protein